MLSVGNPLTAFFFNAPALPFHEKLSIGSG